MPRPEHLVAEVIDGELSLLPRPGKPHAAAEALELALGILWADVELGKTE